MIISVASGKGGTGKTTVATSLALSISSVKDIQVQFLDCDVEEPNAHIFLKPLIKESKSIFVLIPKVDESKCSFCGKCAEICAYNAIAVFKDKVLIFSELCHSCGGCVLLCPKKSITEVNKEIGIIEIGESNNLQFIHGILNTGEVLSPSLIRAVKKCINSIGTVIIDAPPGTSCPVIEAIKGSDFCILVTEPTPFGLNDLILAVEVLKKMDIPFGVVVNRADTGSNEVENYCSKEGIKVLMKIPFERKIAEAYSRGITIVEAIPRYGEKFVRLFEFIKAKVV
jgi:MinD superfamily P-loop ATPase